MRVLVVRVPIADAELAADRLWAAGARAVEECAPEGPFAELRTVLAESLDTSLDRLGALPSGWTATFVDFDDEPAQTWRQFARPVTVNDALVIRPAWLATDPSDDVLEIAIEPGGSFGLGDHPTTRLSADATFRLTLDGASVLDVGCGSGVLSVIAARRGASRVVAIDVAEAAREATEDNAIRNGVAGRIAAGVTPLCEVEGVFDLVVANILAPTLVSLAGDLRRLTAPQGRLVLSGVLAGGHDHVLAALRPMKVVATTELEGWASVELRHG